MCQSVKALKDKKNSHISTHLQEKDTALYRPALEELRRLIRSSTTSMTSVPKPLKFLRPHYGKLKEIYEGMAPGENKVRLYCAAWKFQNSGLIFLLLESLYEKTCIFQRNAK